MFNWLFYLKCFLLSINHGIRFKLPNNFPIIAGNEEKSSATYLRHCCLMIWLELNFNPSLQCGSEQNSPYDFCFLILSCY